MPAVAPLEDLERAYREIESLKMKHPEAFQDLVDLIGRNRSIGYNNLSKMLLGERTPRELKGLDEEDGSEAEEDAGAGGDPAGGSRPGDETPSLFDDTPGSE